MTLLYRPVTKTPFERLLSGEAGSHGISLDRAATASNIHAIAHIISVAQADKGGVVASFSPDGTCQSQAQWWCGSVLASLQ